jgi:hypothetical protein
MIARLPPPSPTAQAVPHPLRLRPHRARHDTAACAHAYGGPTNFDELWLRGMGGRPISQPPEPPPPTPDGLWARRSINGAFGRPGTRVRGVAHRSHARGMLPLRSLRPRPRVDLGATVYFAANPNPTCSAAAGTSSRRCSTASTPRRSSPSRRARSATSSRATARRSPPCRPSRPTPPRATSRTPAPSSAPAVNAAPNAACCVRAPTPSTSPSSPCSRPSASTPSASKRGTTPRGRAWPPPRG